MKTAAHSGSNKYRLKSPNPQFLLLDSSKKWGFGDFNR
jgi:hypothetical protein